MSNCGCKPFCEHCGRDYVEVAPDGSEFCNECAADGFTGELCHPNAHSCCLTSDAANRFERQFMCWKHKIVHWWFCRTGWSAP